MKPVIAFFTCMFLLSSLAQSVQDWTKGALGVSVLQGELLNEGPLLFDATSLKYLVVPTGTPGVAVSLRAPGTKPIPFVAKSPLPDPPLNMTALAVSRDGKLLLGGGGDGQVYVWSLGTGKQLLVADTTRIFQTYPGPQTYVVGFSGDGKTFWSGHEDRKVRFWNLSNGKLIEEYSVDGVPVLTNPRQNLVLAVREKRISLWDLNKRELVFTRPTDAGIRSAAFNAAGDRLVVSLSSFEIEKPLVWLYEVPSGQLLGKYGANLLALKVALSPDGKLLALTTMKDTSPPSVTLWDVERGEQVRELKTEPSIPGSLTFDHTGRSLAVALSGELRVWTLK